MEMSAKVHVFLQLLALSCNAGDKMILFSQSRPTLDFIELLLQDDWGRMLGGAPYEPNAELRKRGTLLFKSWARDHKGYFRIDGDTQNRQSLIDKFNADHKRNMHLFLISTKAGNMGINLQSANRVIIFDSSWNPTNDLQAMHRAYRFGQTKPVFVYRLLTKNSCEEAVYRQQIVKQQLAARVVDGEVGFRSLSLSQHRSII